MLERWRGGLLQVAWLQKKTSTFPFPNHPKMAAWHPSLTSMDFTGNTVTHYGVKRLLRLARSNPQILSLHVDDPLTDPLLLQRLKETLEHNVQRAWRQSVSVREAQGKRRAGLIAAQCTGLEATEPESGQPGTRSAEATGHVRHTLLANALFQHLRAREMDPFLEEMRMRRWDPGAVVVRQGDVSQRFHVVTGGQAEIVKDGHVVALVGLAQTFGELDLLNNSPAVTSVRAIGNLETWSLDGETYRRAMAEGMCRRRAALVRLLNACPVTQELTNFERLQIADALDILQ
eukprot:NODE_724_length_1488_cov_9.630994_g598_i0.p1 GENE.NODE_724_length_1488_cov_9.630994_g598_i0~~NODE_724_length_1488_cov_9.630994_g598_i0.p1  ORF type:complete len:289 (+),score=58.47 NODE_724_length_1488_cov_9.630994_g598_i0:281-1147(+)